MKALDIKSKEIIEMLSFPLISVIMPTYNHADLIQKSIKSVIEQTYQNFEIIIINNYSTDRTLEVIALFNDNRIKVINFHNFGFIGKARNVGIEKACGDYIAFLDSDDQWSPEKLELSLKEMYITKSDVCAHNMVVVQKDREPFIMYSGPQERSTFENLLFKGNCIILSSAIVSRKVIDSVKGFTDNEKMLTSEDFEFWVRISKCGFKFCFINSGV